MQTAYLLYRSRTRLEAKSPECADILASARSRNAAQGLTGYLHLEDGMFYQWLEGPAAHLDGVTRLIMADTRHNTIEVLWRGVQPARQFQRWHMGFGTSKPGTLFDWVADKGVAVSDPEAFAQALLEFLHATSVSA